jgi:hypothetical protein
VVIIKILESDIKNMVKNSVLLLMENAETNNINNEENERGEISKEDVIRMFAMKEETTLNGYAWGRKFKKRNYHGYVSVYPNLIGGYTYFISLFRYEPNGEDIPMIKHVESSPQKFIDYVKGKVNPIINIL